MAPIVRTVCGDVSPDDLSITYCHDHLIFELPQPYRDQIPDMCLDDPLLAQRELTAFKAAGGSALVEMTTRDVGRDISLLHQLAVDTGIHIVAATGFNKHIFSTRLTHPTPVEILAATMTSEINSGIDGTSIRAGVLKAATSLHMATADEIKVIQAIAQAHLQTNAPVSTHTEAGTFALEQIELLHQNGVPHHRMLIGHLDRKLERDYHLSIAETGVYMGFDQIGKEQYASDNERVEMIKFLIDNGYGNQITLSGDMARQSYWPSYGFGHGPGQTHILWNFVPRLFRFGLTDVQVKRLLIDNPRRFLQFEPNGPLEES